MPSGPDLSGPLRQQLDRILDQARALRADRPLEAAQKYRQAAELQTRLAEYAVSKDGRLELLRNARTYAEMAERLEQASQPQAEMATPGDDLSSQVAALRMRTSTTWEDIAGLAETKSAIQAAYAFALVKRPDGVERKPVNKILLYGPPGTGKTMLAAAASNELDAAFYHAKGSNLVSKWFGESSRLVTALYGEATRNAPAVIFLEEFDALAPRRATSDSGAEKRIVSTLLAELDGLVDASKQEAYVLTIAATNLPWDIDPAILSRFGARLLYVPLPDAAGREQVLRGLIDGNGYRTNVGYDKLVATTKGFSGRDLANLVNVAIERMEMEANPEVLNLKGREELKGYQLRIVPLTKAHFDYALTSVKPRTTNDDIRRYEQWRAEAD